MCLNFWWLSQVKLRLSPCEAQSPKISLPSYYPFATIKPTRGLSRAFSCVFSACASKRPVTCTPKMWTEKQSQQTNTARWLRLNLIASPTIGGHIESYPWEPGGTGLAKRLAHCKTLRCWTAPQSSDAHGVNESEFGELMMVVMLLLSWEFAAFMQCPEHGRKSRCTAVMRIVFASWNWQTCHAKTSLHQLVVCPDKHHAAS